MNIGVDNLIPRSYKNNCLLIHFYPDFYYREDKENFAMPNQPESGIKKKTTFTTPTSKVPIGRGTTPTYRGQTGLTTPTHRLQTGIATPTNIRTPNSLYR